MAIIEPWQYKMKDEDWANLAPDAAISKIANALNAGMGTYNQAQAGQLEQQKNMLGLQKQKMDLSPKPLFKVDPTTGKPTQVGEIPYGGEVVKEEPKGSFHMLDPKTRQVVDTGIPTGTAAHKMLTVDPKGNVVEIGPEGPKIVIDKEGKPLEIDKKTDVVHFDSKSNRFGKDMTDEQKDYVATELANKRWPPTLIYKTAGFGGTNMAQLTDILMRANKKIEAGGTELKQPIDLATWDKNFTAQKNMKVQLLLSNFDTVQKEIEKLEKLNKIVPGRSALPAWNHASLALQRFFGGQSVNAFDSGVKLFQDSLSTILANGVMTDNRLKIAQESLQEDNSPENFEFQLKQVVQAFVDFRKTSVGKQIGLTEEKKTVGPTQNKDGTWSVNIP